MNVYGQRTREEAITNASENLNRCVEEMPTAKDQLGVLLGLADWYSELKRCLYKWEEGT
jgi:hypothetical protein